MVDEKKSEMKCYSLSGSASFKGFVKHGLDSSTLINLVVVFDADFEEFKKRGFSFPPDLFYFHALSKPETIGVLINKHKFSKSEALEVFNKLQSQFNLKVIQRIDSDELYEQLAEEANQKIIEKYRNPNLKIGDPDIIIIGGFLREQINFVHSADKGFLKTCEELKFNIIPMPKQDIGKENEIKRWMKKS